MSTPGPTHKRLLTPSPPESKRQRISVLRNPFVDIEAGVQDGEESEEEESEEEVDEDEEEAEGLDITDIHDDLTGIPIVPKNRTRIEETLDPVISRIERRAEGSTSVSRPTQRPRIHQAFDAFLDSSIPSTSQPNDALMDALRMPALHDPPLWRVKVYDSARRIYIEDAERNLDENDTYNVLHQRLLVRPALALTLLSSVLCPGWLAVESWTIESVQELCRDVSTIPQPPRIEFVPLEERVSWLYSSSDDRHLDRPVPSWARLRSATNLGEMRGEHPLLSRYAGDLVVVVATAPPCVNILVVPRLPVRQPPGSKRKYKRCPRLIVADNLDILCNAEDSWNELPRNVFWHPYKKVKVEWFGESDVFRLKGIRVKETFYGPFARFENVHTDALEMNVRPSYSELNMYAWGYGHTEPNPAKTFLKQSYEQFLRAPLQVGHRVCVVSLPKEGRLGNVVDVHFDLVTMQDEATEVVEDFPDHALKRIFKTGDTVRVHSAVCINHSNQEGWVVEAQENEITVVDSLTKEPFTVKPWQLVPCELAFRLHDQALSGPPRSAFRAYDPYSELVNKRVVIGGHHPDKGFRGRIRLHVSHQVMRVELESGMRLVDVHVNQLLGVDASSPRLQYYYVRGHAHFGIPHTDYVTQASSQMVFSGPTIAPPTTPPWSTTSIPEDCQDPNSVWNPSYNAQDCTPDTETLEDALNPPTPADPPPIIFNDRVLAHDWLYGLSLVDKRIWVHITNTSPSATSPGFNYGLLEGERGLIISAAKEDEEVTVHLDRVKTACRVPLRFLCPEAPTRHSQTVVVLEGERKGQVLLTRAPTSAGLFPLVPRRQSKGKAPPLCELPPTQLARCDIK